MLVLNMLKIGVMFGVIIFIILIINFCYVLYSVFIFGSVCEVLFFKKCFMFYVFIDEVYVIIVKEMEGNKKEKYLFYGLVMIIFWVIWVLVDFFGVLVGVLFFYIEKYGFDFVMVVVFIVIVVL